MNLKKLLVQMKRYSGPKGIPICGSLRLEGGKLTSTDLDVFVEAEVPFKGTGLIPVERLKKIADKNTVTNLYIQDGFAIVETPKGEFKIQIEDNVEDFPTYEGDFGKPFAFTIDKEIKDLKYFALPDKGLNDRLKGVHFSDNGEVVATDGIKIKWLNREVKGNITVPKQLFGLPNGDYQVSSSGSHCKFQMGEVAFILRTVSGPFPNYRAVIPEETDNPIRFKASRTALIEQVENCVIAGNEVAPVVEINERGVMRSYCIDFGTEYKGQVKAESNEAFNIAFDANHLLQALKTSTTIQIEFKIKEALKAVLLNDDVLLMPIQDR